MDDLAIETIEGGVVFCAKIVPGSSKTAVCGVLGDKLKVKVAAAAEKGKANQCLIGFLAERLGVKKNAVRIVSGQSAAVKQIEVLGVSAGAVVEKLGGRADG